MAQLDWNLGGGGSSSDDGGGSTGSDEVQNPEAGLPGGEGSTETGSATVGWNDLGYSLDDDSGGSGGSDSNESGVDEKRNPEEQLRYESGLDDDSTGTGSTIVTSGGDPAAGAVSITPGADAWDFNDTEEDSDGDGHTAESLTDTAQNVVTSVTRERNQDNREDNDIPTVPGGTDSGDDEPVTPLNVSVREDDGSLNPAVAVGLLVLAGLVFGGG